MLQSVFCLLVLGILGAIFAVSTVLDHPFSKKRWKKWLDVIAHADTEEEVIRQLWLFSMVVLGVAAAVAVFPLLALLQKQFFSQTIMKSLVRPQACSAYSGTSGVVGPIVLFLFLIGAGFFVISKTTEDGRMAGIEVLRGTYRVWLCFLWSISSLALVGIVATGSAAGSAFQTPKVPFVETATCYLDYRNDLDLFLWIAAGLLSGGALMFSAAHRASSNVVQTSQSSATRWGAHVPRALFWTLLLMIFYLPAHITFVEIGHRIGDLLPVTGTESLVTLGV